MDPERIVQGVERAGFNGSESLIVSLAAHATIASPLNEVDVGWMSSAATRIGDTSLLVEMAGVVFAFNTVNRIANALQVQLEYRVLRKLKPIRGWIERRLASLTGLAYDLSYRHQPRHSPAELQGRLSVLFKRLDAPTVPNVFQWLGQLPVVLEGVLEMLEVNVMSAGVRLDLLKEAAAIAVASRAIPGSGLRRLVDQWLPHGTSADANTLRTWAAPSGATCDSSLESACRRYSWQIANAAHTISGEQLRRMSALGLGDTELLDLTITAALFSALAIIEPISSATEPTSGRQGAELVSARGNQVQSALSEDLAV